MKLLVSPIPCAGREEGNPLDGYDWTCDYAHADKVDCDACIVNGGRMDPRTGKRWTLTSAQVKGLELAARSLLGVAVCHWPKGLARAAWERMMVRLCKLGLCEEYVHGGYQILPAGRDALTRKPPSKG